MDAVILARIQFALTVGFHYIFPPLTIGMAWLIVWMMGRYRKTGDPTHGAVARFWFKLFVISFSIGVATGIVMEFQFGTNWSEYSRFVGDIFGAPLAAEGVFAFFLESVFMGVLLFGWKRFSRKVLWFASLMVAFGSTLSAFWIIVADSWMQTPAGFKEIVENGVVVGAELTDFWAAVFNPSTIPRYFHTIAGALATGAFFVLGVSAWYLKKKRDTEFAKYSMKIALVAAFGAAVLNVGTGHFHGQQVAATQPEKFAAIEGLYETTKSAPMVPFGYADTEAEEIRWTFEIPGLMSWLAFGDWDAEVKGLRAFPKEEWPPVVPTFYTFHLMVMLGMAMLGLAALGLFLWWRKKIFASGFFLTSAMLAIPLPQLANQLGWISAEMGRQPWIVYKLLKTQDAVSVTVPPWQILASIIMFVVVYTFLGWLWIYLLKKSIKKGPEVPTSDAPSTPDAPASTTSEAPTAPEAEEVAS